MYGGFSEVYRYSSTYDELNEEVTLGGDADLLSFPLIMDAKMILLDFAAILPRGYRVDKFLFGCDDSEWRGEFGDNIFYCIRCLFGYELIGVGFVEGKRRKCIQLL